MISAEPYLKTQRVATALGVSVSTVKRWVDSGMIRAARTVGKHRLIPTSEAIRLAREQGLPAAKLEVLTGLSSTGSELGDDRAVELLEKLLHEGKAREARSLVHSLYNAGWSAVRISDDLIRPVMERIGHGWMVGALDVYQEHEATLALTSALRELVDRVGLGLEETAPLALGATIEGDPYVLAGLLGELVLRDLGWQVRNLGNNLPMVSLAHATIRHRPKLVFISVNYIRDEEQFLREYRSFYEKAASVGSGVIVGGQALRPDLRSRLIYASHGERMAHLAEFARRLYPRDLASAPEAAK
jgi:MerR family transcriptional regulator, light-induced transcriptional regulator